MAHFGKKPNVTATGAAPVTSVAPDAEIEQAEAPKQAAPKPKAKTLIRAVHGTMIHPFVPMDLRTDADTLVDEIDSWLQSQIDEKKLVIV